MQAEWPQKRLPDFVPGKVPQIRGKLVHFPGINSENGGIINIFEGKVYRIRSKLVHFPLFHMRQTMSHKRNKQRPVNAPLRHIRLGGTKHARNIRPGGTSDPADPRVIGGKSFEPFFEKREHVTGHFRDTGPYAFALRTGSRKGNAADTVMEQFFH